MIKITTTDIDDELSGSESEIRGSSKEIICDFYALHDTIQKNKRLKLFYDIAIKKWESEHEDN